MKLYFMKRKARLEFTGCQQLYLFYFQIIRILTTIPNCMNNDLIFSYLVEYEKFSND